MKLGKQEYNGIWSSPGGMKRKMQIKDNGGQTVRCIDCTNRKECNHVRINKHSRKPCKDYVADLYRESNKIRQRQKKKEADEAFEKASKSGFRMDKINAKFIGTMKGAIATKTIDKARAVGMSHMLASETKE